MYLVLNTQNARKQSSPTITQMVNWEPMFAACCASVRYFVAVLSLNGISAARSTVDVIIGRMAVSVTADAIGSLIEGIDVAFIGNNGIIVDMF